MVKKWNGKLIGLIVLLTCILFAATAVAKDVKPSATVSIKSTSVAIGIGVQWGDGVLSFKGKEYKFKIEGLSVIDVGVTKIEATGNVYHLDKAADFAGTFTAASADIALGGGVGATTMKNQNGIVMNLTSTQKGIKLKLAPEGMTVQMK